MSTEMNRPEPDLTEFADLVVALDDERPRPTPEFTERLDQAVADHFPEEWSGRSWGESRSGFFAPFLGWIEDLRDHLVPVATGLAALLVVAAVGIGLNQGPGEDSTTSENSTTIADSAGGAGAQSAPSTAEQAPAPDGRTGADVGPTMTIEPESATIEDLASKSVGPNAAGVENRKVAQEAEITLGTKPEDVQDVSNQIVDTVDEHNGIVLDSEVQDGPAGEAGAEFSLMIPSAKLESAIAELSGIADLRARNQETEDITAPTLTVEDSLQTSRARVESLVGELAEAGSDEERAEIEDELGQERRKAARLTTRLNNLERKANLTPVAVTVETGGDTSADDDDSSWGVGDALDDAGRMLAVAAGVALIALAVAIPIAALVLIALAFNRAWVRRARKRALNEN